MIKKLFSINYYDKQILELLKATLSGIIASNFLGALFIVYAIYQFIPTTYVSLWFALNIVIAMTRFYTGKKLGNFVKENNLYYKNKYLKYYIFTTSFTALLYGGVAWLAVLYDIPDVNIFIIGSVIIALTAGSIATIGAIYIAFVLFMFFSLIPMITALIYHKGIIFYEFSFILNIYLFIHLLSGYRLFLNHKDSITLEKKFYTMFNKSSDGIVILKNNKFLECNETVIRMFGYDNSMEEFLNTELYKLMPKKQADNRSSAREMIKRLKIANSEITTFEWIHTKKNGDNFWVEITLRPIYIDNEKFIHGIWRDIDEEKKAKQEIIELNKSLEYKIKLAIKKNEQQHQQMIQQSKLAQMGEMLSMIAHQWRQPLNAISATSGNINLLAQLNNLETKKAIELSQNISDYAQHLSETIDDFRNFFKSNKEKKITSYNELIKSVLGIVESSLINKNIQLIKKLDSNEQFYSYANEIKQVILNLIKNAEDVLVEKMIKEPYIKIYTYKKEDKLYLEISDNGGGIDDEIIDKIFEPYFSTKIERNGTGLGLYMSKTIIEKHCLGELNVYNNQDGAVFQICLKPEFDNKTPIYRATKRQSFKKYPLNLAKARF